MHWNTQVRSEPAWKTVVLYRVYGEDTAGPGGIVINLKTPLVEVEYVSSAPGTTRLRLTDGGHGALGSELG